MKPMPNGNEPLGTQVAMLREAVEELRQALCQRAYVVDPSKVHMLDLIGPDRGGRIIRLNPHGYGTPVEEVIGGLTLPVLREDLGDPKAVDPTLGGLIEPPRS